MPENIHDKGYKRLLTKKKNFLSLLTNFVKESWVFEIKEEDLELIDKEFILKDFKDKEADIIYSVKFKEQEIIFYCLLELQSTVDYTMPFRLLIYITELWRRYFNDCDERLRERKDFRLPAIVPMVLYNGADEWTAVRSFKEYLGGYEYFSNRVVDFEYIFFNVNHFSDRDLQEIGNLISSVFLLDKEQNIEKLLKNVSFIASKFSHLSFDEQIDFMDWCKDVLIKKAANSNNEILERTLSIFEKGDVEHMTYAIERLFDQEREKARAEGEARGEAKGRAEGEARGEAKGRAEGEARGEAKGIVQARKEMAREMLSEKEPLEKIIKFTKLSLAEINELAAHA